MAELLDCVAEQALVDHHCHGVLYRDADQVTLESLLTEGPRWPGGSMLESQAGFAFRRLCPPILGLPPDAGLADYADRLDELGGRVDPAWSRLAASVQASAYGGLDPPREAQRALALEAKRARVPRRAPAGSADASERPLVRR